MMPDKKYPWIWTTYVAAVVAGFATIEGLAIATGNTTLSRYTWEISQSWPILPFVLGFFSGGFAVHIWWHWNPPGSKSQG
jgi:hypothetical protein